MGKKSLLSSTSKKKDDIENDEGKEKKAKTTTGSIKKAGKTTPKKKTTAGAAARKKASPAKKAAPKKKTSPVKKAAPKKKTTAADASKAKAAVKPKAKKATSGSVSKAKTGVGAKSKKTTQGSVSTAKSNAKPKAKTTTARKKPVSIKDLLLKKFETSMPEKKYTPPGDQGGKAEVTSPPFAVGATPEETERIRQLLFKKFDMTPSDTEPEQEKLSGDVSPSAASASAQDDSGIDMPSYSAVESADDTPAKKMDSTQKMALIGILGLIVLLGLVVGESIKNSAKYYLKPAKGEVEVWKGRFSPLGKKRFVTLKATPMPTEPKEVYGKNEIFSFIFESYIDQADGLLNASDMPDFELIKRTLNKAKAFAVTSEFKELIQRRLSKIKLMTLVYKADILAGKDTVADLSSARDALEKAMRLDLDAAEKGLVNQKLQWIDERRVQLERMEAETEEAEPSGIDEQ